VLTLCVAIDAADAGCEKDPARRVPGGQITFVERDPVDRFCYYCSSKLSDDHYANLVFLPLVRPEPNTREPMAALATEWSKDLDTRSITFTLNPEVRWEWGDPISARDVKATFIYMGRAGGCVREAYRDFATRISAIEELPDNQVRFVFQSRADVFVEYFYEYPILPSAALLGEGFDAAAPVCTGEGGKHYGAGPYLFSRFRGTDIVFEANPLYMGGDCQAYIDKLEMRVVGDRSLWPELLANKAVDLLIDVPVRYAIRFTSDRNFQTKVYGYLSCVYVAMNLDRSLFQDRRVRQALVHAYHRDRILRSTFQGRGEVLASPIGSASRYFNTDVTPLDYSPETAERLLQEAGLTDQNGNHVLEWRGNDITLDLVVSQSLFVEYEQAILFFKNYMSQVGVRIEVKQVDDNRIPEIKRERDFDLLWGRWEFVDGASVFKAFTTGSEENFFGYADNTFDGFIERATQTDDPLAFSQFLRSAQARLATEAPMVFLWNLDHIAVHSRRVRGLKVSAYNFFDYIEDAYLATEEEG
jgi:peptide/nickel transport system substrate-binding protein